MTNPRTNDKSGSLFNDIMTRYKLRNDAALAEHLQINKAYLSQIRNGKREIGDTVLVRICEKTGLSIKTAKAKIAERRP